MNVQASGILTLNADRASAGSSESGSFAEELAGRRGRGQTEMAVRQRGGDPAAVGPLHEALLDQERLEHVLDRVALLADGRREIVDAEGFDALDRRLLELIIDHFDGGPVGVESLAAALSEERGTIEDVLEPFLIQQGFLMRTARGRMVTSKAYRHLGLKPPRRVEVEDLFEQQGTGGGERGSGSAP